MNRIKQAVASLVLVLLAACAKPQAQTTTGDTPAVSLIKQSTPTAAPSPASVNEAAEEAAVKDVVEAFGKRLQNISLLAPDAAQQIRDQYSGLVSSALLAEWTGDVSKAPGRMVSSPWPDRIEITSLDKEDSGRYIVSGSVIDVTSVEMANGGAAAEIPVRIIVQKDQGSWLISEYSEER